MSTVRIAERSMTIPPSFDDRPDRPWPPLRTEIGSPLPRAAVSAAATSSAFSGSRMIAGEAMVVYVERRTS
jgi:hypothetical protein